MYFLIIAGIVSLRQSNKVEIDYLSLTISELWETISKFGIKPKGVILADLQRYKDGFHSADFLFSILFKSLVFGFSQVIDNKYYLATEPSTNVGILGRMFDNINLDKLAHGYIGVLVRLFRTGYYNKYTAQKQLVKENTQARKDIAILVKKFAKTYLENVFKESGTHNNFPIFTQDRDTWHRRTEQHVSAIIDMYTMNPGKQGSETSRTADIVREIRIALFEHRDAKIFIKASSGGPGRLQAYAGNPLIEQGFYLIIPYAKLKSFFDEDVSRGYTLNFYGQSSGVHPLTVVENNVIQDLGYFLDANIFFTKELKSNFGKAFTLLSSILKKAKWENGFWMNEELTVKFYVQNGGGVDKDHNIIHSFGQSYGFKERLFNFNPSLENELNQAILSILFYLFTVRDSVVAIYAGGKNFLNLDILNIYTGEEFASSTLSRPLTPDIIWGKDHSRGVYDHLTIEEYRSFQEQFKKFFSQEDLSLFTAFSNMESGKEMLWYLWQHCIKKVFTELGHKLDLIDLTDIGLNRELPYSSTIHFK